MKIWRVEYYDDKNSEYWDKSWEKFHISKDGATMQANGYAGIELTFGAGDTPTAENQFLAYHDGGKFFLEEIEVEE